eukprot:CAMPEP_0119313190 /NCGR_PEP_ID=MMETSP1333-20130426/28160_1 /TAXON_ID=418940 /ORGANISM="Scyphosphaera apsteinii, Strain RCC1455" /LENGTH=346 /DNA_ID=CAMNT_0007317967 /DNA_START=4 /DNA_END=1044 /DNA_ORIENTATION=+
MITCTRCVVRQLVVRPSVPARSLQKPIATRHRLLCSAAKAIPAKTAANTAKVVPAKTIAETFAGTLAEHTMDKQPRGILMLAAVSVPVLAVGAAALYSSLKVVAAGHAGVVSLFGQVERQPRQPGLQVKHPLATLTDYSLKTHKTDFSCTVPSNEGLNVELHISVQYRLNPDKVVELYTTVGDEKSVHDNVIAPQVHAIVRAATSAREAKAMYTSERENIRADILAALNATLVPRGIVVEDVPLRKVVLPARLQESIERKLQMEQESERMDWVLKKESQEAERKAIEAKGIADFQRIVTKGIDDRLLRWKGIEATMELAKSDNSKVVVVGSGKDGLPLILGGSSGH